MITLSDWIKMNILIMMNYNFLLPFLKAFVFGHDQLLQFFLLVNVKL